MQCLCMGCPNRERKNRSPVLQIWNDFVNAAWLVCMFIVVSEDIFVLAIGVGLNSVIQLMLIGSTEIEQEQQ